MDTSEAAWGGATHGFIGKRIALITYGSFTRTENGLCVNRALGLFADGLADYFTGVLFFAAEASRESSLYLDGKSIYTYRFGSPAIQTIPLCATEKGMFSRLVNLCRNAVRVSLCLRSADWVHVFMPGHTGLMVSYICCLLQKPFSLYFGSAWEETARFRVKSVPVGGVARWLIALYGRLERVVVRHARFCLTAGPLLAKRYRTLNPGTHETVPLVQFNRFRDSVQRGPQDGTLRLLCVGNIQEQKGTMYLVEALGLLVGRGLPVRLQLIGARNAAYQAQLEAYLHNQGLKSRVRFAGYVSDPAVLEEHYRNADIFVLPTLGEGFPRVLYEAMLAGLPIVASDIPTIREGIGASGAAVLVPPRDARALASAIERLWRDPRARADLIKRGMHLVERKLGRENPVEQLVQFVTRYLAMPLSKA